MTTIEILVFAILLLQVLQVYFLYEAICSLKGMKNSLEELDQILLPMEKRFKR